jgi:hypothetical protein
MAARSDGVRPIRARASAMVPRVDCQMASASCSTRPGEGARLTTGVVTWVSISPAGVKMQTLRLVVPASRASRSSGIRQRLLLTAVRRE